jgi:hypothetical protein
MNAAILIGLVADVVLVVWIINSIREIKGRINAVNDTVRDINGSIPEIRDYLRRIALSLPVSPEQMRLINQSSTTEELMELFQKAGGKPVLLEDSDPEDSDPASLRFQVPKFNYSGDLEILKILRNRKREVIKIMKPMQPSDT